MNLLGAALNFTFSVRHGNQPSASESWSDVLLRDAEAVDLTGTYWAPSSFRSERLNIIKGHLDLSLVLVVRQSTKTVTIDEHFSFAGLTSFLAPFSWNPFCAAPRPLHNSHNTN